MIIMIIYDARLIGAGFVLEDPALPSECSAASTCRHCPTGSSILGWWGFEQRSSNWPSSIQCLRMLRNLQIYGGHDPHHWAMLCSCVSGVPFPNTPAVFEPPPGHLIIGKSQVSPLCLFQWRLYYHRSNMNKWWLNGFCWRFSIGMIYHHRSQGALEHFSSTRVLWQPTELGSNS